MDEINANGFAMVSWVEKLSKETPMQKVKLLVLSIFEIEWKKINSRTLGIFGKSRLQQTESWSVDSRNPQRVFIKHKPIDGVFFGSRKQVGSSVYQFEKKS